MKEIIIDIDEHGNVRIEGVGFEGPECKALTKVLEDELTIERVTLKPEYHRMRAVTRTAGR